MLKTMDSTECTRSSLHVKQMTEAKLYLQACVYPTAEWTKPNQTVCQRSRACTKAFLYEVLLICKYTLGLTGSAHVQTQTRLLLSHSFNKGTLAAHQNSHSDGDVCVMGQASSSQVCTALGQWTSNCPLEQERLRDASVILIVQPVWVVNYSWDAIQAWVKLCVSCVRGRERESVYVRVGVRL